MSKQVKNLIYFAGAVVILLGALFLVKGLLKDKTPDGDEPGQNLFFHTGSNEDVMSVHVSNQKDTYTVNQVSDGKWEIAELSEFEPNEDIYSYVVAVTANFEYYEMIAENCDNLAEYGLDDPWASGEVAYRDGTTLAVNLGIEVPNTEGHRYLCKQGENNVYIVPLTVSKTFGYTLANFVSPVVLEPRESNYKISEMVLGGTARPDPIVVNPTKPTRNEGISYYDYMIYSPCLAPISVYEGEDLAILPATGFTAHSTLEIYPDAETIASYNLEEAEYTITYTIGSETIVLKFSWLDKELGQFACMLEGGDAIYLVYHESAAWADSQLLDVAFKYVYYAKITQVKTLTFTTPKGTYVFELSHSKDDEGNGILSVTCNGEPFEDVQNFRNFFSVLSYVRWENTIDKGVDTSNPEVTVRIDFLPELELESDVVTYTRTSERRYALNINGDVYFDVASSYVNKLISDIDKLFDGTVIITDY